MITARTALRFHDKVVKEVDVVIIGGGVIGVFTALYLRRAGKTVALYEKGRVAGEQSSRNWGWIRQQGRDAHELPLAMEARRLWQEVDQQVQGRTGYTQGGVHYLASTEKELENLTPWLEIAARHELDSRLLSTKELSGLIQQGNNSKHRWIASLYTASDGRAEPWQAVPAVAELAHSEGVSIREDCAVRSLDIQGGQIIGVVTESGTTKCGCAVLAGGAWSSLFLRRHSINIPQLLVRGTVARTVPLPEVLAGNAIDEELAFRRRQDGRYSLAGHNTFHFIGPDSFRHIFNYLPLLKSFPDITLMPSTFLTPDSWTIKRYWQENETSPFEITRVLDPPPDSSTVRKLERLFKIRFPDFNVDSTNLIENAWGGMIDTMPDIVPIVDTTPTMKGLVIATGMSAHGFGIGPSYGRAISNIVTGAKVEHDLSRFRFQRFTDGSKLSPGPSL